MTSRSAWTFALVLLAVAVTWGRSASAEAASPAQHPRSLVSVGTGVLRGLTGPALGGQLGGAAGLAQGVTGLASSATTGLALAAIGAWVSGGATSVLHETAHVLGETTAPQLGSPWFSTAYWRVAGIAAVLTLPFLFAASIQALVRSDLSLLIRAALGYLPLAMLAVAIAAPLTMLLLSASDELASAVSSAAGDQSVNFLDRAAGPLTALGVISGSPFLAFLVALVTVAGALVLWVELLMREAAVYVIVLMLPVAFAGLVWPARRIWAIRSVEVLVALILSKFAIVAVLSLGGAALGHSVNGSIAGLLAGIVLLILGAFAPWALLRLLPLAEVASGTAGALRGQTGLAGRAWQHADGWASEAHRWMSTTAQMRRMGDNTGAESPTPPAPEVGSARAEQEGAFAARSPAGAAPESASADASPADASPADARADTPSRAWITEGEVDFAALMRRPESGGA